MEETREMKRCNYIGYCLEDGIYYLVDFEYNEILDSMDEVAFLFDVHKDLELMPTMLKHGHPDKVNEIARVARFQYSTSSLNPIREMAMDLAVIQGKFPIEEIDKMLSISGYMMKVEEHK